MYYETTTATSSSDMMAALAGLGMVVWLVAMVISILMIVSLWKIFTKAGKPGWGSIVPFYNFYLQTEIAFGNGWLFLLYLVPIANIVMAIMTPFKMAKAFGKGTGFGFGLWLIPIVFYPILAFGDAEYQGAE